MSELLLSGAGPSLHPHSTEGMFTAQTLKAVQPCLEGRVLGFIILNFQGEHTISIPRPLLFQREPQCELSGLLSNMSVQLGLSHSALCYISAEEPWVSFLFERDRLEGIKLPWLFGQGCLIKGVSSAEPAPCFPKNVRLQPAEEKLPFVVARYPHGKLREAEQKFPTPVTPGDAATHTNGRIWEWVYLVNISVFSLFLAFKLISQSMALKEQEIPPQMRKEKIRSPSLFLFPATPLMGLHV